MVKGRGVIVLSNGPWGYPGGTVWLIARRSSYRPRATPRPWILDTHKAPLGTPCTLHHSIRQDRQHARCVCMTARRRAHTIDTGSPASSLSPRSAGTHRTPELCARMPVAHLGLVLNGCRRAAPGPASCCALHSSVSSGAVAAAVAASRRRLPAAASLPAKVERRRETGAKPAPHAPVRC